MIGISGFITYPSDNVHRVVIVYDIPPHIVLYPSGRHCNPVSYPILNSFTKPILFSYKTPLILLEACEAPNHMIFLLGNPSSFFTYLLEMYSNLFLYPSISGTVISSSTLKPNPDSSLCMISKTLVERQSNRISSY